MMRPGWRSALDVVTTLALLGAAVVVIVEGERSRAGARTSNAAPQVPVEPISLEGAAFQGNAEAKAGILEFVDYECPSCERFSNEIMPVLANEYIGRGKVLFALKHWPLEIHRLAEPAAETAECAGRQGKFWEAHDRLFSQKPLDRRFLDGLPDMLGLDAAEFRRCLAGNISAGINRSADQAKELGLKGTPTFLIGTLDPDGRLRVREIILGARGIDEFKQALDAAVAAGQRIRQTF